jgi:hypothetical protein
MGERYRLGVKEESRNCGRAPSGVRVMAPYQVKGRRIGPDSKLWRTLNRRRRASANAEIDAKRRSGRETAQRQRTPTGGKLPRRPAAPSFRAVGAGNTGKPLQRRGFPQWAWVDSNIRPHAYQDTATLPTSADIRPNTGKTHVER